MPDSHFASGVFRTFVIICFNLLHSSDTYDRRIISKLFSNPLNSSTLPFQKMVVERRYTGRVYVAGVNRLYQLNADLQQQNSFETGPVNDSPDCSASSVCDPAKQRSTDNHCKALALYERANKLIACGSVQQGICRTHNLYNISSVDPPVLEPVVANDASSSSVVFVAPGPPDPSTTDVLYVASTYTDVGQYRDEVPAVATLSLQPENSFKVVHHNINSESQVQVERSKRKSYKIDYVFGFASGNFSYGASRQQISSNQPSAYHSKLIRVCQRDRFYYSYTEVPLRCKADDGTDFNLIQAAYLGKAGFDLARNLSISTEDDLLFAVFAKGEDLDVYRNVPSRHSALCVFTLKSIEAKFAENVRNCAKGEVKRGLDFIKKDAACLPTTLDTLCGSEVNYPLGGNEAISGKPAFVWSGLRSTAVVAATVHMYTVAIVGSDDGRLKKMVVETDSLAVEYDAVNLENGRSTVLDLQLDISTEFLYILTASSVSKMKLYNCDHFDRCASCLHAKDPYCGWCSSNSKCSSKSSCDGGQSAWLTYKENQCTEISKVTPDEIPITHVEYLNLDVQNLPNFSGQLSCVFSFGDTKWTMGAQRVGPNAVSCNTPQPNKLPPIPDGSDHLPMALSLRVDDGADFASTNFTFFNCSSYSSCTRCARSSFRCDWCLESSVCSHNADSRCLGQALVNSVGRQGPSQRRGPGFCPRIEPQKSQQPLIYAPSGSAKRITLNAIDLIDSQRDFSCRFELLNRNYDVLASVNRNDNTISCSTVNLVYSEASPNFTVALNVLWRDQSQNIHFLDNPSDVRVVMYKCEMSATSCGQCLTLAPHLQCGWCSNLGGCTVAENCAKDGGDWLQRPTLCPNPVITNFSPRSSPIEGGTTLTIEGVNLGLSFEDVRNRVKVNQVPCPALAESYSPSRRIVCVTGPSPARKASRGDVVLQMREESQYLAVSDSKFSYVDPRITGFSPKSGPQSGGTVVTLRGEHLDAGSNVSALIAGIPCAILRVDEKRAECKTSFSTVASKHGGVSMMFDNAVRHFIEYQFTYEPDPVVLSMSRDRSILSGGLSLQADGLRFDLVQNARIVFTYLNRSASSSCAVEAADALKCTTPNMLGVLSDSLDGKWPIRVDYAFRLDDALVTRNVLLTSNRKSVDYVELYADPVLYAFSSSDDDGKGADAFDDGSSVNERQKRPVVPYSDYLIVRGKNLDQAVKSDDVKVLVGGADRLCNLSTWQSHTMTCKLPPKAKPTASAPGSGAVVGKSLWSPLPEVTVVIGEDNNLNYTLGFVNYEDPAAAPTTLAFEAVLGIVCALALFAVTIAALLAWYRRKSSRQRNQMKRLKDQIDAIELKVASECKEAFAELQTDMTELTADVGCCSSSQGIPFLSYRHYAMQVLFPGQHNHPVVRDFEVDPQTKPNIEKGLQLFNQLLMNKHFLLLLVRTMESNRYFVSQARVAVGSLLMVILQEKMEYCTEVLKALLVDLIDKTIERRYQPKILFRRSESVAERMLGIWYTLLLYRYILECAGQPLFMLYWAIKQQVEKGPQDNVTFESRYSLSEEKLIRQTVDYHALTVYVSMDGGGSLETPVRVFDCDTVLQVKEKCLDAIFKNTPYSRRPSPNDVDLEWRTGVSARLILQDFNSTTKVEQPGNWRRMNTFGHYKVPNNASLALVPKQVSVYNMSLLSERSDKSSNFSLKNLAAATNSPTLNSRPLMGVCSPVHQGHSVPGANDGFGTKDSQEMAGNKVYHLIKPNHHDHQVDSSNLHGNGAKMMSEIYLTRLLTTKGTLQKFVEDLFEAIFSTAYRGSTLPVCVKYMFDFMDDQALRHGITDPEVVHAWKSNSLPLRFWVNLINNPHFVFDIARPVKIGGCLSVVAQTLMDSCSTQDPQLTKDSPSSKLLFARDIHTYREWVERYYADIRSMPVISDQDMSAYLNDESRTHAGEFNVAAALNELYTHFVQQYAPLDQLHAALEADDAARRHRLPSKFAQLIRLMDGTEAAAETPLCHSNRSSSNAPPPLTAVGAYAYGDVSLPR